jgi:hypothetical protein
MIGYFVISGDSQINNVFQSYKNIYNDILKNVTSGRFYDDNIDIILIEYHIQGEFLKVESQELKLKPYRKSEKSIAVIVPVNEDFLSMNELQRRCFIANTTLEAVKMTIEYLLRKKIAGDEIKNIINAIELASKYYIDSINDL